MYNQANISLKKQTPSGLGFSEERTSKMNGTVTYLMDSILNLPPVAFFKIDHCVGQSWPSERAEAICSKSFQLSSSIESPL